MSDADCLFSHLLYQWDEAHPRYRLKYNGTNWELWRYKKIYCMGRLKGSELIFEKII